MGSLSNLYRDIVSNFSSVADGRLRKLDVTNLINQTIADVRTQFIQEGLGKEFLYTETIWATVKHPIEHPFLYRATLDKTLMRGLPIAWTVQHSLFWETENELEDTTQSWSKGDLAIKDDTVYEALEDISSQNTYDLTFEVDNVKNYYNNNGLEYKTGDIVYNQSDGTYWRCTSDYTNNQGQAISGSGNFEQLFWRRVDDAYQQGSPVKYNDLFQTQLFEFGDNHFPFSIKEDEFYTPVDNTPITISYIPEWEYVEDFDTELTIPDLIVQPVRNRCIRLLGSKLGIQQENLPEPMEKEDE